jgi:FkbH-like protein
LLVTANKGVRHSRDLDYFQLLKESGRESLPRDHKVIRLALLADCATQHFVPLFRALFMREGIRAEVYEGAFDAIDLESRNPQSALYSFRPDIVVILNSVQTLRDKYYRRLTPSDDFCDDALRGLTGVWESLRVNTQALVIQSNYVTPVERIFGNFDYRVPGSLVSIARRLNTAILAEMRQRSGILLNDIDAVASWVGRKTWFDERLWCIGKSFCALDYLPLVADSVVKIALANLGKVLKCVVVDLDNTLWGGVVGDDGPNGIQIGAHGDGEPFYRLQSFLKELKKRGILLAVCSKNEHANAISPFRENSEMVLKMEDFSVFMANWDNKADNLRKIGDQLGIGLDSMLFLDDNPFERDAVRTMLPEVNVPELPEDAADYVKALAELNLFETSSFSSEDVLRSDLYEREAQRRIAQSAATSFDEFLQSLATKISVSRFVPEFLPRITQLLQRSNQFNLTTNRHNQAQCEAMMNDTETCLPLFARLKDRFGDHGLISIVIARPNRETGSLVISDWVMSCRVLTRGVEEFLMNYLVGAACQMGLNKITGSYIPTAKNAMVKDFYSRFDFARVELHHNGASEWQLRIEEYRHRAVFILPEEPHMYTTVE